MRILIQPRIYHIWKMNKDLSLVSQSNHFIIVTQFLRESKVRALFKMVGFPNMVPSKNEYSHSMSARSTF